MKRVIAIFVIIFSLITLFACNGGKKNLEVKLTFVSDGEIYDEVVLDGSNKAYMPQNPSKLGHLFCGWYYDENGERAFTTKDGISKDTILYAKWKKVTVEDNVVVVPTVSPFTFAKNEFNTYTVVEYKGESVDVVIPASYENIAVQRISNGAFAHQTNINSITLSANIKEIDERAFVGCSALAKILVPDANTVFASYENDLYNKDKTEIYRICPKGEKKDFAISKTIKKIQPYAFDGCTLNVTFVDIGEYRVLGSNVFNNLSGKITLNKSVAGINKSAFTNADCVIEFDKTFTMNSLSLGAFDGYNGNELVLPESITSLGEYVFSDCKATVDLRNSGVKHLGKRSFAKYKGKSLFIPKKIESIDQETFYMSEADVTFDKNSTINTLPRYSFSNFKGTVALPLSLTAIESDAFYNVKGRYVDRLPVIIVKIPTGSSLQKSDVGIEEKYVDFF